MTDAIVAAAPLLDNICDITKRAIAKILATNLHWTFPSEEERTKLDADRFILNSAHDTWLKDHGPTDRELLRASKKTKPFLTPPSRVDGALSGTFPFAVPTATQACRRQQMLPLPTPPSRRQC